LIITPRDVILAQINHEETLQVPYTLICEDIELDKQLNRHYNVEKWQNILTKYIVDVGGIDTVLENSIDDVFTRDAFGSLWRMDRRPFHLEVPGMKEPNFDGYDFPTHDQFVNPNFEKNVKKSVLEHSDNFSIINIGWGLFEQTWRIRGFKNALVDSIAHPEFYFELLDKLTELRLSMVEQCVDIPADAIMFGDDWGDQHGVILGPKGWRKYLKPAWKKIYEAVHKQGKFSISHCCGSIVDIMPDIIEIGLDVLESVQPEPYGMNPYKLKKKFGDKITFWGCLGSQSTIQFGTPNEIREEINRLITEIGKGGGYIIAPSKAFQPKTPLKNAIAVIDAFINQK
jgi:uroporphyrinogen decarboxylase